MQSGKNGLDFTSHTFWQIKLVTIGQSLSKKACEEEKKLKNWRKKYIFVVEVCLDSCEQHKAKTSRSIKRSTKRSIARSKFSLS